MRFCTNCGTRLPENGKFCIECGQKVQVEESVAQAPVQPAPPVQESYAPPVQESYAPPVQETYVPPVQETYVPPVQETYVPPVQQNFVPAAPVKKKPFDKRLLIPIIIVPVLVLAVVAIVLFSLLGGQSKVDEEVLGVYYAVSCDVDGYVVEPEEEWIELMPKGKATLELMDEEYDCKWSLDGKDLTVKCDGDTFEGTLKNGVIELDFEDMFYVFEKEDLEKEENNEDKNKEEPETVPAEEVPSPVGYWTLIEMVTETGESYTGSDLEAFGDFYIHLYEDGTGEISANGEVDEATWTDTEITDDSGTTVTYELKDGQMHVDIIEGIVLVMVPGDPSTKPAEAPVVSYQSEPGTYTAYYGYSGGMEVYEEDIAAVGGIYVTFYGDGTGMISIAGDVYDMTYDADYLYCDGETMEYYRYGDSLDWYLSDDTWYYLSNDVPAAGSVDDDTVLEDMDGDWYGWWTISDVFEGDTEMIGNWWDACASLYMNGDGTADLILWDEDTSWGDPLAEVTLEVAVIDNDVVSFVSTGGNFLGDPVEYGEWIFYSNDTEYTNALGFYGTYADEDVSLEFYFFLRPWGILWDDIEEGDMPYYYYDWYLPMLEEGWEDAPAVMELP